MEDAIHVTDDEDMPWDYRATITRNIHEINIRIKAHQSFFLPTLPFSQKNKSRPNEINVCWSPSLRSCLIYSCDQSLICY